MAPLKVNSICTEHLYFLLAVAVASMRSALDELSHVPISHKASISPSTDNVTPVGRRRGRVRMRTTDDRILKFKQHTHYLDSSKFLLLHSADSARK